jgi:hypothetical protein
MVTELSALVKSIRTDVAKLQTAQHADAAATASKLDDFERRLLFAEAKSALNEAKAAGTESADDAGLSPIRPLSPSKAAVAPKAGRPPVVKTAGIQTEAAAPKRYRVQAASPGLAMLGEVDRTGDDGSPLQVAIGTEIPGYGKVKSIDQRGTTWVVVTTEGGSIQ